MSDELRRLETLERLVRHLTREVAELRDEVRASRPADAAESPRRATLEEPARVSELDPARSSGGEMLERRPAPATPRAAQPVARPADASRYAPPPVGRREERLDLERLVGRYGTVALAVLTIVMGVGVFLRWAIEHVQVGPVQRVAAGAIVAVGLGIFGWRLRERGARQYGDMLVGLSLALVHVVAWGAGPYLRVVPDTVALVIAAAASVLLAVLAWHEREQPLFAAGLGGAFLAPFVTTRTSGSPEMLLGYAIPIVVSGTLALRRGDWRVARRILAMGTLLFAGSALATLPDRTVSWRLAEGPAFAIGAAVVAQLAAGEGHRRALAYTNLGSALLVLVAYASSAPSVPVAAALCLAGALVAAIASRGEGDAAGGTFELALSSTGSYTVGNARDAAVPWVGAVGFPLAFMGVALFAQHDPLTREGALLALAFAVLSLALAGWEWRADADRRGAHLVTSGIAGVVALLLALRTTPVTLAVALVALGVVASVMAARTLTPLALVPALLALVVATATAMVQLMSRAAWQYVPFATTASLAALATVAGWWLASREAQAIALVREDAAMERAPRGRDARLGDSERRIAHRVAAETPDDGAVLRSVAYTIAFLWGHEELRHAWSPAIATFALIAYYAVIGVASIGVGRMRASSAARRVGLALAVFAGLKAIVQASSITAIGLRVGSYLLVGGFLLGVAWWYRAGATPPDGATSDTAPGEPGGVTPDDDPAGVRPITGVESARAVHNAG